MEYFKNAMGFLTAPSKSFEAVKGKTMGEAFKYMLVLAAVVSVLNGIVIGLIATVMEQLAALLGYTPGGYLPIAVIGTIIGTYIGVIIGSTIYSLWLHLWAYILGARKGLDQTVKSVYYGSTPYYLLGWIPFISLIFGLWSLALEWIGLVRLQGISKGKAAVAVIIAVVIPTLLILAFASVWLYSLIY